MPKLAVVSTTHVKHVLPTTTVDGVDQLPLVPTVLVQDQMLEYAMETPGSTTLEITQILAQIVLPFLTANLASIMKLIACGAVLLALAKNGALP